MLKGIYTAASGMVAETIRTDVIANNLANASTTGYKKDLAVNKSFGDLLLSKLEGKEAPEEIGGVGSGVFVDQVVPTFAFGVFRDTGNTLDLALEGDGFFAVETPNGERYTRDGAFHLDQEGYLVTADGHQVLGENGPINLAGTNFKSIVINANGQIFVEQNQVASLRVVDFADKKALQKEGNSLWIGNGAAENAKAQIRQGTLESSNVNTVTEMVNLITATRAYEISQKMIQTQDSSLDKAVNEVGRVG